MRKSDLFKNIYETIIKVQENIGENYDHSTIELQLNDEEMELNMPTNTAEFVKTALNWYSQRTSYVLASALTEILAEVFSADNDADVCSAETVKELTADIDTD